MPVTGESEGKGGGGFADLTGVEGLNRLPVVFKDPVERFGGKL